MTKGSIFKNILLFSIPLVLGNLLQLFYNAADIIVVGRCSGSTATASVGATGAISHLLVCVFIGLSVGVSVVLSKSYGSKDYESIGRAVHTSILMSFILGFVAMIIGIVVSKPALSLMGTPQGEVYDGAVLYMRLFFIGAPASLVYNFGAAVLRAFGDTRRPLYILAGTGLVNVLLNLLFVMKFNMGVAGVAIATAVANYLSAILILLILTRSDSLYKLDFKKLRIHKKELEEIVRIGLPAGLQSSLFSISNSVIQSAVNSFGAAAMAGSAAGDNIGAFVYTAMNAFYQAVITSVSQNYGAKDEKRVRRSIYVSAFWVTLVGVVFGTLTAIFAEPLLGIYITDSPKAIEYGIVRMIVIGLTHFLCGVMDIISGALRGLGHSVSVAVISLVGVCGTRLLWVGFVLPLRHTIGMLFLCWPLSWFLVTVIQLVMLIANYKKDIDKMYNVTDVK